MFRDVRPVTARSTLPGAGRWAPGAGESGPLWWPCCSPPGWRNAQETDCRLVSVGGYTHSQRFVSSFGPSEYRHHASGGVDYRCADGTRVRADSAVVFESDNQVQLYGNVRFEDPDTELRADSATYFSSARRLTATSRVEVTDRASGTVIRGDNLIYDQASEFRTLDVHVRLRRGAPGDLHGYARAGPGGAAGGRQHGGWRRSPRSGQRPGRGPSNGSGQWTGGRGPPRGRTVAQAGPAAGRSPRAHRGRSCRRLAGRGCGSCRHLPPGYPTTSRRNDSASRGGATSARAGRSRSRGTRCRHSAIRWTTIRTGA